MVNAERIEKRMKDLMLRKESICAGMGISLNSLNNKLHGRTSFTVQEMKDLSAILGFSQKEMISVFLGSGSQNVNSGGCS